MLPLLLRPFLPFGPLPLFSSAKTLPMKSDQLLSRSCERGEKLI